MLRVPPLSPPGAPALPATAFLQQPQVAVRVAELGERHVVRAGRVRSGHPRTVDDVLHLADFDTPGSQFVAGSNNVGNNEQPLLLGARLPGASCLRCSPHPPVSHSHRRCGTMSRARDRHGRCVLRAPGAGKT